MGLIRTQETNAQGSLELLCVRWDQNLRYFVITEQNLSWVAWSQKTKTEQKQKKVNTGVRKA